MTLPVQSAHFVHADMSPEEFIRGLRLFFDPFDITYSLIKTMNFS